MYDAQEIMYSRKSVKYKCITGNNETERRPLYVAENISSEGVFIGKIYSQWLQYKSYN